MWCVVHVKDKGERNMEELVAGLLPEALNARCFHLIRSRRKKYEGQWHIVHENLFPGYVFIDTDKPEEVYRQLKKAPRPRLLFSDDGYVATLEAHESDLMKILTNRDGIIEISRIRIGNDGTIKYLSGPLVNVEDKVKRVNLHKRVAEVEVSLMGHRRIIYLGIDFEDAG